MQFPKLHSGIHAAKLAIVAIFVAIGPAHAYSVYRAVDADPSGVVVWTKVNFGVSGKPISTLSFFHYASDEEAAKNAKTGKGLPAQCLVKVDLGEIDPSKGDEAQVGNADVKFEAASTDLPKPFPWTIVFDDNPPGHWSIARAEMTSSSSNTAASRVAAAGFKALAITADTGVTVINGTLNNCRAQ
ncbi:hypothetical protein [Ensifer adhaerens]|uniref:hypothetical protein n=1 Tax=Ensifer adhaerens TaxID=106592 RepID=UPI000CF06453|nr:hypothetical protein [Ensifer adhaerens]